MKSLPFVSVIVPVRNGEKVLRDCVGSILKTDYPLDRLEILVVDNGSTDGTAEIIKSFPVRYVMESHRGAPAARNAGVRACRGDIIVFTDADCVVSQGWLGEVLQAFEEDGVGGVAGEIVAYNSKTPAERYAAKVRHLSPRKYLARPHLPFAVFANLAFRGEVFDKIGLLDDSLIQGDSTDFCTRFFRETGLKLKYAPKAVVFHRHRTTTWEFFKQQWYYGRGHALLYIKYRQEIPWGWKQTVLAYQDVAKTTWRFIKSGIRYTGLRSTKEEFYFCYFEFLKRLAERIGFLRETVLRGYMYF